MHSCVHSSNGATVTGSTVAVERVFSGGRDTIGIRHASLKPETVRTLMLVKAWARLEREKAAKALEASRKAERERVSEVIDISE